MQTYKKAVETLHSIYGYSEFRKGQSEAVKSILNKKDTLVVMPTGGGKSICYQIPALISDGTCIIISPLIALMKDQVDQLLKLKLPVVTINSQTDYQDLQYIYEDLQRYKLIYISPERLENESFLKRLEKIDISFFAVDEAHCISQWGHDFRPSYRNIVKLRESFKDTAIMALTATATIDVADDIVKNLLMEKENRVIKGFERENLVWTVLYEKDKFAKIFEITKKVHGSGIIYASTRSLVEEIYQYLISKGEQSVNYYHAGLSNYDRNKSQDNFINGRIRIMVATNAFGMGIDKADVRFVVHHQIPPDIENYYQEAGRAGRDQKKSYCVLLYQPEDKDLRYFFLNKSFPSRTRLKMIYRFIKKEAGISFNKLLVKTTLRKDELRNILEVLDRHKWIEIDEERFSMIENNKSLETFLDNQDEQHKLAEERLKKILLYAEERKCRRNLILSYFGEDLSFKNCKKCDICLGRNPKEIKSDQESYYSILELVSELDGRYGQVMISDILKGSQNKRIESGKLFRLDQFASLEKEPKRNILNDISELINHQYISKTRDKYPVLNITTKGKKFIKSK